MSYSHDPSSSDRDHVRYIIGDTDESDEFLGDNEIDFELVEANDDVVEASIRCIDKILAKISRLVDYRMHGVTVSGSQAYDQFSRLRRELLSSSGAGAALAFAGGLSQSETDTFESDLDRRPGFFKRDMHDNTS